VNYTFKTLQDALDAGYRLPNGNDRDISGPSSRGYDFLSPDDQESVDVWFTEDKRKSGEYGVNRAMFPPK